MASSRAMYDAHIAELVHNNVPSYRHPSYVEWHGRNRGSMADHRAMANLPGGQNNPGGTGGGGNQGPSGGGGAGANAGPTDQQRQAAGNLGTIAGFNADATRTQFGQQMGNFDMSDEQNRALADRERTQASRNISGDRFAQQSRMQSAAQGLIRQGGNAFNSSTTFDFLDMLRHREDLDNAEAWNTLRQSWESIEDRFTEAYNANRLARNDLAANAEFALRGIEADTAAQRNNIHPDLFVAPGSGAAGFGASGFFDENRVAANLAQLSGYITPDNAQQGAFAQQGANQLGGGGHFAALMNQYNQRRR